MEEFEGHELPSALRDRWHRLSDATTAERRHYEAFYLWQDTILFLGSVAFADYRLHKHADPSQRVEDVLLKWPQPWTRDYVELLRASLQAAPRGGVFSASLSDTVKLASAERLRRGVEVVRSAVEDGSPRLERSLSRELKAPGKRSLPWGSMLDLLIVYRDEAFAHVDRTKWDLVEDFYECFAPLVVDVATELLRAPEVQRVLTEFPIATVLAEPTPGSFQVSYGYRGTSRRFRLTASPNVREPAPGWSVSKTGAFLTRVTGEPDALVLTALGPFHDFLNRNDAPIPLPVAAQAEAPLDSSSGERAHKTTEKRASTEAVRSSPLVTGASSPSKPQPHDKLDADAGAQEPAVRPRNSFGQARPSQGRASRHDAVQASGTPPADGDHGDGASGPLEPKSLVARLRSELQTTRVQLGVAICVAFLLAAVGALLLANRDGSHGRLTPDASLDGEPVTLISSSSFRLAASMEIANLKSSSGWLSQVRAYPTDGLALRLRLVNLTSSTTPELEVPFFFSGDQLVTVTAGVHVINSPSRPTQGPSVTVIPSADFGDFELNLQSEKIRVGGQRFVTLPQSGTYSNENTGPQSTSGDTVSAQNNAGEIVLGSLAPHQSTTVAIASSFEAPSSGQLSFGGDSLAFRVAGDPLWLTSSRVSPGQKLEFDLELFNTGFQSVNAGVRVALSPSRKAQSVHMVAYVSQDGGKQTKLGAVTVSSDHSDPISLQVLPGTTRLLRGSVPSCHLAQKTLGHLPDGIADGLVDAGDVGGYKPKDPCQGEEFNRYVNFEAVVR